MSRLVLTLFVVAGMMFSVCFGSVRCQSSRKHPIFTNQKNPGWLTNLDDAYAQSKNRKTHHGQLYRQRLVGWCKNLLPVCFHNLNSKHGQKKCDFVGADFPRRKIFLKTSCQQNANLQQAFQVMGYPTVWVLTLIK